MTGGCLGIGGVSKEIIGGGGQKSSISEVENYLMPHPDVERVAVVGVPHERLGETGCAVVVLKAGQSANLAELTRYLVGKGVAKFKLPEKLEIWPTLPTTPSGKVQKFVIRQQLAQTSNTE